MKHVLFVLLALPVPVLFAQKPSFDAADLEKIAESEAKAHAGKIVAPSGLAASGDYDVRYHRLEWQVDPAVKYINGKATTYFEAKTNGFGTVQFDLMDSLKVDWVRWHGQPLFFSHHNNILRINLPQPLAKGALDSLTVQYQGRPATTGFGSFVQSAHGDTPIIWTLSEPYGARDWWPCKQDLSDKIDSLDVLVTCPAAYRAAGNGLLVSEKDAGAGKKTYHWRHRYPIACYLVCLAVTNYAVYSDYAELQTGTLPILNYVFPENLVSAQAETPQTIAMLEFLDSLFISYPFHTEKYGHAQFVWGGGMEHQTMSFMGYFGYELTAHELAHQWFGDYITCGSWADIWLNEGFATYLSGLIYERFSPNHDWSGFRKSRIDAVVSQPDGSVWVNDTTVLGRIFNGRLSYAKGAMVLHMLRWALGDEVFFTSVRNYLNDPALANGFARTADLQDHLEAASGQDLDWFFNDWIYGQGHPSYQIVWHQTGNTVTVQVNQTQSHASVPFFEVPLPLRFKNGTQYYDARLQPTVSGQVFQLTLPFTVTEVLVDPDLWLISANNTVTQGVVGTEERPATSACLTPNPTTGLLRVSLEHGQIPEYVEVFDAAGKMIRHLENTGAAAVDLDLSALPAGVYEVRILGGNNSPVVGKVLKR